MVQPTKGHHQIDPLKLSLNLWVPRSLSINKALYILPLPPVLLAHHHLIMSLLVDFQFTKEEWVPLATPLAHNSKPQEAQASSHHAIAIAKKLHCR